MQSLIGDTCKLIVFCFLCSSSFFSIVSLTKDYFSAAFPVLDVECESVKLKGTSSQTGAVDSANSVRPKEGTKENITVETTNNVAETCEDILTNEEIFRKIVSRRLQVLPPSTKQEFDDLNEYMSTTKGIVIQDVKVSSLLITVKCRSLLVLEDLWIDYTSGHLNEMVQKCLVTEDILYDLGLSELKLCTIIRENDYKTCQQILQKSG